MFMDSTNYDQISVSKQTVGDATDYLLENAAVVVAMHEGNPLFIELPASVTLKITYTEPGIQGDRSSGGTKPATVETGITIQVPLFIKQDEMVLVDTRTGEYLGRAN
jgi:elongation factor P